MVQTALLYNNNKNIFIQDDLVSAKVSAVINDGPVKPGSHDSISISIRAKQKAKQRNQVKPAT